MSPRMTAIAVGVALLVVALAVSILVFSRSGIPGSELPGPTGADTDGPLDKLLRAQRIKLEDIQANRSGQLSPRQTSYFDAVARGFSSRLWLGLVVFIGVAGAMCLSRYEKSGSSAMLIIPGAALGVALVIYFGAVAMFGRPESEVSAGKVTVLQGTIEKLSVWPSRDGYMMTVGGTKYTATLGAEAAENLREGQPVKAYVVAGTTKLVAIDTP